MLRKVNRHVHLKVLSLSGILETTAIRSDDSKTSPIERLVSFDIIRGGSIFCMVFVHVLMKTYDIDAFANNPELFLELPIVLMIIAALIGYLGMWISFFVLLSATVNAFVMTKKVLKGTRPEPILFKQLLNGVLIWCFGRLQENIIGYFGYLGTSLRTGDWANISRMYTKTWTIRALDIIAWCIIINALIHYFLMIEGGYKQYLRNVLIYLTFGAVVLAITPGVREWALAIKPDEKNFFSWFLNTLVLDKDVVLPYLFSSLLGSILGMTLARPKNPKKLVVRGSLIMMFVLALVSFILIFFKIANNLPGSIFNKPPEIPTYLILTIGQIGVILLMLSLIEFRGKGSKIANNIIMKNFRMWGMISLSIFIFDTFEILARGMLTLLIGNYVGINALEGGMVFESLPSALIIKNVGVGINFLDGGIFTGTIGFLWAVLLSSYVLAFYQLFIWLWSKVKFKFGAEWWMIKIQKLITKQESQKLDPKIMLNEVKWISYKAKKQTGQPQDSTTIQRE